MGCPALAQEVLRNADGRYEEHSDFFGSGSAMFGPRAAQVAVGRSGRDLALAHLKRVDVAGIVARYAGRNAWPRAGNAMLAEMTEGILTGPHRRAAFNRLRAQILATQILDREGPRPGRLHRAVRRFRWFRVFSAEREAFVDDGRPPRDLLDMLFAFGAGASTEKLIELYIAFNFALVGSLGFALGWTLYFAIAHDAAAHRPGDLIAESLRLSPVAWLLSRTVKAAHMLGGERVTPGQEIWVFPYAVHRHAGTWEDPFAFSPERWIGRQDRSGWIPFGAGEHICAAISLTFQIVERILTEMLHGYRTSIVRIDGPSGTGPALAPPRFVLEMIAQR